MSQEFQNSMSLVYSRIDNSVPKTEVLPSNLFPMEADLERLLLRKLIYANDCIDDVLTYLDIDSFNRVEHREIYKAILILHNSLMPINKLAVMDQIRKTEDMEFVEKYLDGLEFNSTTQKLEHINVL